MTSALRFHVRPFRACGVAALYWVMNVPAMAESAPRAEGPFDAQALAFVLDCDDAAKWLDFIRSPRPGLDSVLKQGDLQPTSFIPGDATPGQYRFTRPVVIRGLRIQGFSAHLGMMPAPTLYVGASLDEVRRALEGTQGRFTCASHGGPGGKGCEEQVGRDSGDMALKLVFAQDKAMIPTGETMLACAGQPKRPQPPSR